MFLRYIRENLRLLKVYSAQRDVHRCLSVSMILEGRDHNTLHEWLLDDEAHIPVDSFLDNLITRMEWKAAGDIENTAPVRVARFVGYMTVSDLKERTNIDQEEVILALHHLIKQGSVRAVCLGSKFYYCAHKSYFSSGLVSMPSYDAMLEATRALHEPLRHEMMARYVPRESD